jgi:hypothetical protein
MIASGIGGSATTSSGTLRKKQTPGNFLQGSYTRGNLLILKRFQPQISRINTDKRERERE